jgi:hypothetical protein
MHISECRSSATWRETYSVKNLRMCFSLALSLSLQSSEDDCTQGQVFDTPSGAGYHLRKRATNGWSFWLVDPKTKKSLASVRREYLEQSSVESDAVEDEETDSADISAEVGTLSND